MTGMQDITTPNKRMVVKLQADLAEGGLPWGRGHTWSNVGRSAGFMQRHACMVSVYVSGVASGTSGKAGCAMYCTSWFVFLSTLITLRREDREVLGLWPEAPQDPSLPVDVTASGPVAGVARLPSGLRWTVLHPVTPSCSPSKGDPPFPPTPPSSASLRHSV